MTFAEIMRTGWNDYRKDRHPIDRRMRIIGEKEVDGMNTENVRYLINEIVRVYAPLGTYLEVGSFRGASLLSAAIFNNSTLCIGVENFSGFNKDGANEEVLNRNLIKFGLDNVRLEKMDFRRGFAGIGKRLDVYFYDGHHDYEDQIMGLEMSLPFLKEECVIIVDDTNWPQPDAANKKFLDRNRDFRSLLSIKTTTETDLGWWNGIEVMGRGIE